MARTQDQDPGTDQGNETGGLPNGAFPYGDDDIIVPAAAKDATRGVFGVLPAPTLPAEMNVGMATATMVGLYYDAVRKAQSIATKAVKDGKDVGEAVRESLASFKPDTDRTVRTISSMRLETARKMVGDALTSRGIDASEANVEANLKNGYIERHRAEIDDALLATLAAGYEVQKKGKGAGAAPTPGAVIDDL